MAQDLAAAGVELPALMNADRWKSSKMPARYTERQAADWGAVARYYQGRGVGKSLLQDFEEAKRCLNQLRTKRCPRFI